MKATAIKTLVLIAFVAAVGVIVLSYFVGGGVSARPQPGRVETFVARTVRDMAIAWHAPGENTPVPNTGEAIAEGRAHFADHCASCHANNGSGDTEMGRGLYPRAPDMRLAATQRLSDRHLFYIIENGIRLTGMPAWGTGTKAGEEESWRLVRFIRHLPQITPDEIEEMEGLNPKSPEDIRRQIEEEKFLSDGVATPPASTATHKHYGEIACPRICSLFSPSLGRYSFPPWLALMNMTRPSWARCRASTARTSW